MQMDAGGGESRLPPVILSNVHFGMKWLIRSFAWLMTKLGTPMEIALYVTLCSKRRYFHGRWCAPAHELLWAKSKRDYTSSFNREAMNSFLLTATDAIHVTPISPAPARS